MKTPLEGNFFVLILLLEQGGETTTNRADASSFGHRAFLIVVKFVIAALGMVVLD